MLRSILYIITVCLAAFPTHLLAADQLRLIIPDFKPYTYFEEGEFKGIGVDKVTSILEALELPYSLAIAPNYGRAVEELKQGRVDGLFLASENEERNAVAIFSQPVMINRWSWFTHKENPLSPNDPTFKQQATVATHLNTNTHKWLVKNDYRVTFTPNDLHSLPKTLFNKRVGAVFLAESVFFDSCEAQGIEESFFDQHIEISKPFGIYITKQYAESHPDFMSKLNQAILDTKSNH